MHHLIVNNIITVNSDPTLDPLVCFIQASFKKNFDLRYYLSLKLLYEKFNKEAVVSILCLVHSDAHFGHRSSIFVLNRNDKN